MYSEPSTLCRTSLVTPNVLRQLPCHPPGVQYPVPSTIHGSCPHTYSHIYNNLLRREAIGPRVGQQWLVLELGLQAFRHDWRTWRRETEHLVDDRPTLAFLKQGQAGIDSGIPD